MIFYFLLTCTPFVISLARIPFDPHSAQPMVPKVYRRRIALFGMSAILLGTAVVSYVINRHFLATDSWRTGPPDEFLADVQAVVVCASWLLLALIATDIVFEQVTKVRVRNSIIKYRQRELAGYQPEEVLEIFDRCLASNDPNQLVLGTAIVQVDGEFVIQIDLAEVPSVVDLEEYDDALTQLICNFESLDGTELVVCYGDNVWTVPKGWNELVTPIPRNDVKSALSEWGFSRKWASGNEKLTVDFPIPESAARQSALAHHICFYLAEFPVIIEIVDDGMWNDHASRDIVQMIRDSRRVQGNLFEVPAVLVDVADRAFAHAYLAALMHCMWDFRLVESDGQRVWEFSNDEFCMVESNGREELVEVQEFIRLFKLDHTE